MLYSVHRPGANFGCGQVVYSELRRGYAEPTSEVTSRKTKIYKVKDCRSVELRGIAGIRFSFMFIDVKKFIRAAVIAGLVFLTGLNRSSRNI